jgi:hypothetical protein
VTVFIVPRLVVTVTPAEGSAATAPFAGVIFTGLTGAALARTGTALTAGPVVGTGGAWEFWCPPLEHADASTTRATMATTTLDRPSRQFTPPCPTRMVILLSTPKPTPAPRKSLPHRTQVTEQARTTGLGKNGGTAQAGIYDRGAARSEAAESAAYVHPAKDDDRDDCERHDGPGQSEQARDIPRRAGMARKGVNPKVVDDVAVGTESHPA